MFDERLQQLHQCYQGATYDLRGNEDPFDCPEKPERTQRIFDYLNEHGLLAAAQHIPLPDLTEELQQDLF